MSINRVVITGNLTRDPELKSTGSGMAVLKMGVAVNDSRKNQQTGEWEEVPNYIDVVVFGKRGEAISRFLSKGAKVAIEGKLRWSSWEDKDSGAKRSKIEVIADEIEFLSSRNEGSNSGGSNSSSGGSSYSAPSAPEPAAEPVFEDDIPF